jgi:hypothetical protein
MYSIPDLTVLAFNLPLITFDAKMLPVLNLPIPDIQSANFSQQQLQSLSLLDQFHNIVPIHQNYDLIQELVWQITLTFRFSGMPHIFKMFLQTTESFFFWNTVSVTRL